MIAGASGFVGTHLRNRLQDDFNIRALTRSSAVTKQPSDQSNTNWHQCDLYSLPKVAEAMEGCDYGIYLVHSMAPSSRLVQASFEDTDLLLADNFIRAAEAAGLKHIIYLGGLMPEDVNNLSPHLKSRREVEHVLRSSTVTVTVLRAGLIVGPGGSSFRMLINLVRRLPLMILPAWTRSMTHSIDIENVCEAFELCLSDAELPGGCYDLAGHEPLTYRALILNTGKLIGKRVHTLDVPGNFFGLSKRWVSVFGNVSMDLASPLLESLRHDLKATPNSLLEKLTPRLISFDESIKRSIDPEGKPHTNPRSATKSSDARTVKKLCKVLSVQRMRLNSEIDAHEISREYGRWLTKAFRGLLRVEQADDSVIRFVLIGGFSLLELTPTPYTIADKRRCAFYISGGILSRKVEPMGRLEFRVFPRLNCLVASIHGYSPTLPWILYRHTQAIIHLMVMRSFAKHLEKLSIINPPQAAQPNP